MKFIFLLTLFFSFSLYSSTYIGEHYFSSETLKNRKFMVSVLKLDALIHYKLLSKDDINYISKSDLESILKNIDSRVVEIKKDKNRVSLKGIVYLNIDLKKAISSLDKSITYNRSLYKLKHGDIKGGVVSLVNLYSIDNNYKHINHIMALVSFNLGDYKSAISYYKKEMKIHPKHKDSIYNLARLYLKLGNYNESLNYFNNLALIDDNYKDSLKEIGYIYYIKSEYYYSYKYLNKYIANNKEVLNNRYSILENKLLELSITKNINKSSKNINIEYVKLSSL